MGSEMVYKERLQSLFFISCPTNHLSTRNKYLPKVCVFRSFHLYLVSSIFWAFPCVAPSDYPFLKWRQSLSLSSLSAHCFLSCLRPTCSRKAVERAARLETWRSTQCGMTATTFRNRLNRAGNNPSTWFSRRSFSKSPFPRCAGYRRASTKWRSAYHAPVANGCVTA